MPKKNRVFIEDECGKRARAFIIPNIGLFCFRYPFFIKGLNIKFKGRNSTVTIGIPAARFSKSKFVLRNNSSIKIASSNDIIKKLKISMTDNQKCSIGKNFFTWDTEIVFSIGDGLEVNIGEDGMFSRNILIRPSDGHALYDVNSGEILNHGKSINIGKHVWLAGDNAIFKGADIEDNCTIGKGSIVTKPCNTPNSVYAGVPAKIIKTNVNWRREEPDKKNNVDKKIDIVYLWCDLSDEKFKKKKEECAKNHNVEYNADNDCRYKDNGELKYSLRSLEKYAPWVNNIFIVTDEQVPKWLNLAHPKIKIIDHKDIMPPCALPNFNSTAILHHIVNIEGLSEYFLYSDDDTLFNLSVEPDFFFKEDKPVCRFIKPYKKNDFSQYTNMLRNGDKLLEKKFGPKIPVGLKPHHNIDAYRKSIILKCREEFKEEIEASSIFPFRRTGDIERAIYQKYSCLIGCGIFKRTDKTNIFKGFKKDSLELFFNSRKKEQKLKKFKPELFCINDTENTSDSDRIKTKDFLEAMYPDKSGFEK